MAKKIKIYPHKVSLNTIPLANKEYSIDFIVTNPENFSDKILSQALGACYYDIRTKVLQNAHMLWAYWPQEIEEQAVKPWYLRVRFSFSYNYKSSLGQIAQKIIDLAPGHSIGLISPQAYIWLPRSWWWLWLLFGAGSIGAIIALIRRKR